MLSERQVEKSFQKLVQTVDVSEDALEKADAMLEHLRPESPLRHRLAGELEELRKLVVAKS